MDAASAIARRPGITGVVLTKNGERLFAACLSSLWFCDSLLIVDCGSTDATVAIAEKAGATVLHNAWRGFAAQFAFAASKVETEWFFILDQDERASGALGAAVAARAAAPGAFAAFSVSRRSWYFDRFMKHGGWSPDHIPRLFRTGRITFSQDAHIQYHPDGPTAHIGEGEIIHYPYTGFAHQLEKLNVYATQGAEDMRRRGKKGGVLRGVGHALARFFRIYVLKAGFRDGRAGFLAAAHGSFYAFLKYVRVLDASWGKPFDHE